MSMLLSPDKSPQSWTLPTRIAYVVSHSYPYSSNGYAVRSHQIARALQQSGLEVIVFNRPGRPWQIEGFGQNKKVPLDQTIDGVRYIFLPMTASPTASIEQQLARSETILAEAFDVFRPAIVLAASNWETAEPARRAAKRQSRAFFYEQRGFWEMSRGFRDPDFANSEAYLQHRRRDTEIAQLAQGVFTLNAAMAEELITRGVPAVKIHIVANGIARPAPNPKAISRHDIGCTTARLLGYIGSLSDYEGCADLLHLLARLRRADPQNPGQDVALMIVGSSAPSGLIGSQAAQSQEAILQDLAQRLGVSNAVHFVKQMPENQIGGYYRLCDAILLPRHATPVTVLVPPLKPYTAAGYGVPVVMSDLPPLAEISREINALLFAPGDIAAMADAVLQALDTTALGKQNTTPSPENLALENLTWQNRVRPMLRLFANVASAERLRNSQLMPTAPVAGSTATTRPEQRFNTLSLPLVSLRAQLGAQTLACLGPGNDLRDGGPFIPLTRHNILDVLATSEPGRFVIDWAGLQANGDMGEWAGLWSTDAMRLNRQVMDACRIALDRGWRLVVTGPVNRAEAPLFRTVAGVLEEQVSLDLKPLKAKDIA